MSDGSSESESDANDDSETQQYESLMREYQASLDFTAGCGPRGQIYIDQAYRKLATFVDAHPNYRLPQKHICQDDGTSGLATGVASMARNDDCLVQ